MHCKICGKKTERGMLCKNCIYFLEHGETEDSLKRMHSDDEAKKVWKENEKLAKELADVYYGSVLDNYNQNQIKKGSKEDFGYNTFIDGIRCGLDIVLPLLDKEMQNIAKEKITTMMRRRRDINKQLK